MDSPPGTYRLTLNVDAEGYKPSSAQFTFNIVESEHQ